MPKAPSRAHPIHPENGLKEKFSGWWIDLNKDQQNGFIGFTVLIIGSLIIYFSYLYLVNTINNYGG